MQDKMLVDTIRVAPKWWPYAAKCFCHMNSVKDRMSPCLRRFNSGDFAGELIPFYFLQPGGKWN
eukprot:6463831-Amphidinium_carterae.3